MKMLIQKFATVPVLLGLMLFGLQGVALAADADSCTAITSVPFTASAPGVYCVTKDLATPSTFISGNAITISADDVTLDLGGHRLSNLAAGTGTSAIGIYALDQKNVTIQNGTVRGFYKGIDLDASAAGTSFGNLVEYVRAEGNRLVGIELTGVGSVARHNQILKTGGTTQGADAFIGLHIVGNGIRALDNEVVDTSSGGGSPGYAIVVGGYPTSTYAINGAVMEGNRLSNTVRHLTEGIVALATDCLIVNNRITDMAVGVDFGGSGTGSYRDNLTFGVSVPYTGAGGTNAGNNQ